MRERNVKPTGRLARIEEVSLRIARWLPVIITYGILIYTYYVYVVVLCSHYLIYVVDQRTKSALYLAFFHILFLPTTFSFSRSVFGDPGDTRKLKMHIPGAVQGPLQEDSVPLDPDSTRYCGVCQQYKPPRTHHCSDCGRCCLKMDHHCVFLNNCVGFKNYKQFYLVSFWGSLLCTFVLATLLQILIWQLTVDRTVPNSIQMLIVACFAFVLGMGCYALLIFHTYIIGKGRTTIEQITVKDHERTPNVVEMPPDYSLGVRHNFTEVLGPRWYLWLLPYPNSKGDGMHFPIKQSQSVT